MGDGDTLLNALIGAAVTLVTSFVPFSPVIGGAVAGYLQRGDTRAGAKVGALSGLFYAGAGALFVVPFLLFVFLGAELPGFGLALVIAMAGILALISAGLGALGGVIGVYVLDETDVGDSRSGGAPGHPSEWGSAPSDDDWRAERDSDRVRRTAADAAGDERRTADGRSTRRDRETEREGRY